MPRMPSKQRFPMGWFTTACALSILTALLSAVLTRQLDKHEDDLAVRRIALAQSIGRLYLVDEQLSNSAHMAVMTGDAAHEQQHGRLAGKLAAEINTLGTLLSQSQMQHFVDKADASSLLIRALTQEAFALAHQGGRTQALALLSGAEYERLRKVYADAMDETAHAAAAQMVQDERIEQGYAFGLALLSALAAASPLGAWLLALRTSRRWDSERQRAEQAVHDINTDLERRVQERTESLRQLTVRLRYLVRTMPAIIYATAAGGECCTTFLSENVQLRLGYSPEDFTGNPDFWASKVHPQDLEGARLRLNSATEHGGYWREYRIQHQDGSWIWLHDEAVLTHDEHGRPIEFIGYWIDIGERKQAQEAQRLSALRHQLLFECSRDALMTLAPPAWTFTSANPAALQLFGAASVADFTVLGPWAVSPAAQPDGCPSDDKAREMITRAMQTGSQGFEWTHQRLDGQTFAADVLLTRMELGSEVFLQATVRDITMRTQQEQALSRAQRELKEAYDSLLAQNIELEASNRTRSQFLAAISHELRTPLNAMIGFSELLKDGLVGALSDDQRAFTQEIYDASNKLLNLLSNILAFSRLEAGLDRLENQAVQADVWLAECALPWREQAAAKGLSFTLSIPQPLGTLWLDPLKGRQIVVDLLSNATKFTPPGGSVTLSARRATQAQAQVSQATLPDPNAAYLEIEVRDSGIGFSAGMLSRLFEPFHQDDASVARRHGGVGLGLALVKRLVDLHAGAVRASNNATHGACVTVWLPCEQPEQAPSLSAAP